MTLLGSAQVESTLLFLKIGFLILLYLFIWRIVRSAARDLRLPQESMILGPQQAAAAGLVPQAAGPDLGKLVVITSPALLATDLGIGIVRALEATNWVLAGPRGAAARLGMKRTTLQSKMLKLGVVRSK